jgi:uncharacterized membrane protein
MQTSAMERTVAPGILSFEEAVEIPAPVSEVYRRWTDLSRFPEFMENIQEVRPLGGGRYHWVGRILGAKQEWDTEISDQQENQRISWRSVNGPTQYGTATFQPLPDNKTQVRLRMEYTPPGGVVGQKLDQLTQLTRRAMKRNLENFANLVRGERELGFVVGKVRPGIGPIASAISIPAVAGVAGAISSYAVLRRRYPIATRLMMRRRAMDRIERRAALGSWLLTLSTIGSILSAANYRRTGQHTKALAIGQYAPTLLGIGILSRMLGHRALKPTMPGAIASWAFTSAAVGSVISSTIAHLRGRRHDGLFIGHWTPTFLTAAVLSRLFTRD